MLFSALSAQTISVEGTVLNSDGVPLEGATVVVKENPSTGSLTDTEGSFKFNMDAGQTLLISYIGFDRLEQTINEGGALRFTLTPSETSLDEVVVVGYGTARKSDLTGAVASVSADELTQVSTPDVLQAMQGRVAGVQITTQSGEPGAGVRVRIRGNSSINNSNPLYVVDGFQTDDISFLNPNDIERIEVLKDASATAIYGSRGANGVVLISTKRGKNGNVSVEFNGYAGTQQAWKTLDMLNASEYAMLRLEAYENDGLLSSLNPETNVERNQLEFVADGNYEGTDWQDEVLQTGYIQNYTVSVYGGNETNRYSLTGTYFEEEGLVKNTNMRKVFLRLTNDWQLTDWLKASSWVAYTNVDRTFYNGDYFNGVLPLAVRTTPLRPAYDYEADNWGTLGIPQEGSNAARIVDENQNNRGFTNKIVGNFNLEATIFEGLTFRSLVGADLTMRHNKGFFPEFRISNEEFRDQSNLNESRRQSFAWQWSNFLTYDNSIGKNNFSVMAGAEAQARSFEQMSASVFDVPNDPSLWYLSAARDATLSNITSSQQEEALASFFGRVNYNYDDRFLLTINARYDGSSRFTAANRWGFFPSFSGGWNIANESFMENVSFVNNLKLRAGWGQVGNQNAASNYNFATLVQPNQLYVFNGEIVQGFIPTRVSNPDLVWETITMTNIGIDAGFMNDQIVVTADYFIKNTTDLITDGQLPRYAGAFPAKVNAGDIQNTGVELAVSYRKFTGDFTYEFNLNGTRIINEVVDLGTVPFYDGGSVARAGNTTRTEPGYEIAYFYGFQSDGLFNSQEELDAYLNADGELIQPNAVPGDIKFIDQNGDGIINDEDRVYLGSATPDFTYGFGANFGYKGLDLQIFLQGTYGNEIVNGMWNAFHAPLGYNNATTERLNRWTPENPNTDEPRMFISNQDNLRFSDYYVEDGSFMRVRNVTLSYTLPTTVLPMNGSRLRIYVASDNLLTFTNYSGWDPEIGELNFSPLSFGVDQASYPQPRRFRVGIDLKF